MNPCNIPKKKRAPRRISVLFASLEKITDFWLPGRKTVCCKVGYITADCRGERFFINPFRSVFVTAPKVAEPESELAKMFREESQRMQGEVGNAIVVQGSPFVGLVTPQPFPADAGRTHFVGDSCPGGHADVPVNNDNNITGPTS